MSFKFKSYFILLFAIILIGGYGCEDFLVPDISEEPVILIAPTDGGITTSSTLAFWWDPVDRAEYYRLEVVSPGFDAPVNLFVNIEQAENIYETDLPVGQYEWRVFAGNSAYETVSDIYSLSIELDTSNELSTKNIELIYPEENAILNNGNVQFLWKSLSGVSEYDFGVSSPNFDNSSFIIETGSTSLDQYTVNDLPEGEYTWRVRGENDSGVTPYTEGTFSIDLTPPIAPSLISPIDSDTIFALPIELTWASETDILTDSLFIYTDTGLTTPIILTTSSSGSYTFNPPLLNQDYYWYVKSIDMAGNESSPSSVRHFFVE